MIKIQIQDTFLDTYADEQIELSWEAFRFQKNLRAGYTNDLKIPKTPKNVHVLDAVGLLDSQTQLFGDKTVKGIIQIELRIFPVYIQVASIDENDIQICLYEDVFPEFFKDKTFRDYFKDTNNNTIFRWNEKTLQEYPNDFKEYNYGMTYDTNYAQFHPVKKVNSFIQSLVTYSNYNLPLVNNDWYYMATKKKVCPQNGIQMIEGMIDFDTHDIMLSGGQQICNDLSIQYGSGQQKITFNRDCRVVMTFYVAWEAKYDSYELPFVINHNYNGTNDTRERRLQGNVYRNKIDVFTEIFDFHDTSTLSMAVINAEYFKMCNVLVDCVVSNYTINDYDYDEELQYIGRLPRLIYKDWQSGEERTKYWDGTSFTYTYKERNTIGTRTQTITVSNKSLSYFGFFTNVPNFKLCDFWFSMQWLMNKKLNFDKQRTVTWESTDKSKVIDGYITQYRPKSDKLGQNNYIKYQSDEYSTLVSSIANEWLQYQYNFHESKFTRVLNVNQFKGKIRQYENSSHESDSSEYKCDFNELEGLALWWNVTESGGIHIENNLIRDIPIPTLGMEKLNQSMEVDIITFVPQLRDCDIIYLDGHKYYIVNCKTNIDIQRSELTCLLIVNPAINRNRSLEQQI